jgi:hypothetical protein
MTNIRIYLTLLVGTLLFQLLLRYQGSALVDAVASPLGIVSLELAPTPEKAAIVLDHWKETGNRSIANRNIWLDFLFIPFYMLLFYTLCGSISVRMKGFGAKLGVLLAFGALVAGLFDVLENILMLLSLSGNLSTVTTALTAFFATAKFLLIALCLLYVIPLGLRVIILKIAGAK